MTDSCIITCAVSGAVANKQQCAGIPYTPEEYAKEVRRARGRPATTINWGPWEDAGVAADTGQAARLATRGVDPLPIDQALALFGQIVAAGPAQPADSRSVHTEPGHRAAGIAGTAYGSGWRTDLYWNGRKARGQVCAAGRGHGHDL